MSPLLLLHEGMSNLLILLAKTHNTAMSWSIRRYSNFAQDMCCDNAQKIAVVPFFLGITELHQHINSLKFIKVQQNHPARVSNNIHSTKHSNPTAS